MECWLLLGLDGISPSCNGGGRENHPSTSFDDDSGSFNRRKSGPDVVFVFQGVRPGWEGAYGRRR